MQIKATKSDNAKIAKRRTREMKTISQMVALYCEDNHEDELCTESAYCGESVCSECAALDSYAVLRTQRCRKMHVKTSCEECENHCYAKEQREAIRLVMRYSGPRMLKRHPIAAIRHLLHK